MIGTIPSRTDALNMAQTGFASQTELSRSIQFGILSGPHDLLVLMLLNVRSTVRVARSADGENRTFFPNLSLVRQ